MTQNKTIFYILGALIALALIYSYWAFIYKGDGQDKLTVCPEAWYENRMPGPIESTPENNQYFVVNGERVELDEIDIEWVKANCEVNSPEPVY